ncbi:Ornithine carbamoyltransferase [Geodia barretti]|uniref:ornithine carbamoyltransferase n=1 Tax=Geodia barretti TaxID=519541 RepID=A0AA35W580_GEOBA|nr:Ornithine carbamoyltransferase [Geodia barretti]
MSVTDINPEETGALIRRALEMKGQDRGGSANALQGKSVALLFEKPSLRTKVSFMVGIQELGGYSLYLGPEEVGLGSREPVSDVARVLSGYVDCIVARVNSHRSLEELVEYGTVPVINALSDWEHPCQTMADLLTIAEHQGDLPGRKLAYIGDGNNVARSLCLALPARPALQRAKDIGGGKSEIMSVREPAEAVSNADIVYTDVWTSMGDEAERGARLEAFQGYTVDPDLLRKAKPTAKFMHDMPAHYGEEVPPGMLEHPQSIAYTQAHNRKHAQKAVLEFLLGS